jgi:hypothetical protein
MAFDAKALLDGLYPKQLIDPEKEALTWAALVLENQAEERAGFGGKTTLDYVKQLRVTAKQLRGIARRHRASDDEER